MNDALTLISGGLSCHHDDLFKPQWPSLKTPSEMICSLCQAAFYQPLPWPKTYEVEAAGNLLLRSITRVGPEI
jgi:hypothetical protein